MLPPNDLLEEAHKFSNSLRMRDDAHAELIRLLERTYDRGYRFGYEWGSADRDYVGD